MTRNYQRGEARPDCHTTLVKPAQLPRQDDSQSPFWTEDEQFHAQARQAGETVNQSKQETTAQAQPSSSHK